jgi:hypothetical protein
VGIGPYAEVFSKSQPMSAVGLGADVGLHPESKWNNPEPEVVLAVNSRAQAVGATLGNDVNLRDIEGRSALLLGKAKDNNASCAIGPFIRLFDERFTIDTVRNAELRLVIEGAEDGFRLDGESRMRRSAAIRWTWCRRPRARTTSTRTASCSSSAPCSRRSKTARRAPASPTSWATRQHQQCLAGHAGQPRIAATR